MTTTSNQKLRILHIARDFYPDLSGVAEVTRRLTMGLALRGHEISVATGPLVNPVAGPPLSHIRVNRFDITGNSDIGIRGDVGAYLDFVLSGNWDAVTIHSLVGWPIELLLPYFADISATTTVVNHSDALLSSPLRRIYRRRLGEALRKIDRTVVLSASLIDSEFYREFRLPPPAVIPNGVSLDEFAGPALDIRREWKVDKKPWLVAVSNHSGVKRHDRFFAVIKAVRAAIPDASGTIIGRSHPAERFGIGRFGIRGGCWYKCKLASIQNKAVTLRPNSSRVETISAIQEADALLLTSDSEASPLVILESMAAGTPWISLNVGCVRDHAGGFLVNSSAEMATAAERIIKDHEYRARVGAEGRARVESRHDWGRVVDSYEVLYRTLGSRMSSFDCTSRRSDI